MTKSKRTLALVSLLLVAALSAAACDEVGPGNVENLPPPQEEGELEENIEESGLEGQTAVEGQEAQEGDTTQEQIESNVETYELGTQEGMIAVSWLLERDVETMNDRDLGEIEDLLIDRSTGRVHYALVEHGGLLDLAESMLPVPLSIFQLREQAELILPVQDDTLWGEFPDLDDSWTTALTAEQAGQISAFWNEAGLAVDEAGDLANTQWTLASTLVEQPLSAGDAPVGQVQDLLIDLPSGYIKYAVVATSGETAHSSLLPYSALDPAADGETVNLQPDFDAGLLDGSPAVDPAAMAEISVYDLAWDDAHESYWADNGYSFAGNQ